MFIEDNLLDKNHYMQKFKYKGKNNDKKIAICKIHRERDV